MNKTFIRTISLAALLAGLASASAHAQLSAKGGGILINSDKLEVFDERNEAVFTGRVDAVQDDARLRADKLDVFFEKAATDTKSGSELGQGWGGAKTIIATGNVFYVTPKQVAKAQMAVYEVANDQVTMTGNVVVTQGKNVIRGDKLVLKISTGRAVFDATNTKGETTGRVRAAFFPAKKADDNPDNPRE